MTNFKAILAVFSIILAVSYSQPTLDTALDHDNVTKHGSSHFKEVSTASGEHRGNTWKASIAQLIGDVNHYEGDFKDLLAAINSLSDTNRIQELMYTKNIPWLTLIPGITNKFVREALMNTRTVLKFESNKDYESKRFIVRNRTQEIKSMLKSKWPISRATSVRVMIKEDYALLRLFLLQGWTFNEKEDLEFVKATFQRGSKYPPIPSKHPMQSIEKLKAAHALCETIIRLNLIIPGTETAALEFIVLDEKMKNNEKTPYLKELISRPIGAEQKSAKTLVGIIRRGQYDWAVLLIEKGWPLSELNDIDLHVIHHCHHSGIKKLLFPSFFDRLFQ